MTKILKHIKAKNIDIAKINTDTYCAACCLKKTQVFTISIRDIEYQVDKKARALTNQKSVMPQEYYNFLDVFSKINSVTFFSYQKYNYKIYSKKEQELDYVFLFKMFPKKLNTIKQYLHSYLAKIFLHLIFCQYFLLKN